MTIDRHQLRVLFDAKIPMCGCGNPEEGVELIYKVLCLHPLYEHRDEFKALIPGTGVEMIVLGLLEDAELNEHGGGIGSSWLTPLGEQARDALRRELAEHPDDETPFDSFCGLHCIHGFFSDGHPDEAGHNCLSAGEPEVPSEREDA